MTEHPGKDYLIVRGGELLVFDGLRELFEAYDQLEPPTRAASFHEHPHATAAGQRLPESHPR